MKLTYYIKSIGYLVAALSVFSANAGSYEDFFRAVEVDNVGTVQELLQRGFDPNTRSEKGQVALYLALRSPSPRVAEALLKHPQTNIDATNAAAETPLMIAALKGETDWARKLVERGAKLDREGWTPVHYAASGPEPQLLALLLDKGGAVNARSPNGTTPLMMAARYGKEDSVDLLLKRGADPKLRNQKDLNAADFAKLDGRDKLAERLEGLAR